VAYFEIFSEQFPMFQFPRTPASSRPKGACYQPLLWMVWTSCWQVARCSQVQGLSVLSPKDGRITVYEGTISQLSCA